MTLILVKNTDPPQRNLQGTYSRCLGRMVLSKQSFVIADLGIHGSALRVVE